MTRLSPSGPGPLQRLLVVAALVACVCPSQVRAESVTAPALKAAFLYNFAKFTGWPSEALAPERRLALCVFGDHAVADALQQTIQRREIKGHELTVEIVEADAAVFTCHLLYMAGHDASRFAPVLEALKSAPVFTVGEAERFVESGGVAQLVFQNNRMRFAINPLAAERARLRLSSKLLSLAKIIKDELNVRH